MAKPEYDDGYEEERSDIADTYEGRQEKIEMLKKRREEEENLVTLTLLEQEDSVNAKGKPQKQVKKRGLSKVFYMSFPSETKVEQKNITAPKVKKKNLGPSSRQRRKTLNKTKSQNIVAELNEVKEHISLPETIPLPQRQRQPDMLSRIGSHAHSSSFNLSNKSFNFDEEAPPQFIPAYYEYQQRLIRRPRRRRYAWQLQFFGVYRRNHQEDDLQTEILSVAT